MELQVDLELSEPSSIRAGPKKCNICADQSDGNHFGVDSCRACAAFFRRSVTGAKKYHCRQGRDSCEVSKAIKSMCRRCRLTKCLTSGMKPEAVRDPIPPRPDPLLPSTSQIQSAFRKVNPLKVAPPDVDSKLLTRIYKEYMQLCSVRKATELAMSGESFRGIFNNAGPVNGFTAGTFTKISLFLKAHIPAMGDFVVSCFPEFNNLEQSEKWNVFRSFSCHFWGLDNNYRNALHIPPEVQGEYFLMTQTTYLDCSNMDHFLGDSMNEHAKKEMSRLVPKVLRPQHTAIGRPLGRLQLDNEEYAFLLGLILWDQEKTSPAIDELSQRMREKLHKALEHHYQEKGLTRYAVRLGELHTIHCSIFQFVSLMREYTELFNLLEAYESDSFIHDFIKT